MGVVHYFDVVVNNSEGKPDVVPNAICVHEEDYGILYKHTDWRTGVTDLRRSRRLVVSYFTTVANYDYGFYYYFYLDGSIEFESKLTGIINTTSLAPGQRSLHRTMMNNEGMHAPIHQHFYCARLDMNVDGSNNTIYEVDTVPLEDAEVNLQGNAFYSKQTLLRSEQQAKRSINERAGRHWRVVNPNKFNVTGAPVAYDLMPGSNCFPFGTDESSLMQRAGFLKHHLWVTPYHRNQKFPGGDYPNQSLQPKGLPEWTQKDRPITNTDIVLWYVMGALHQPRLEDFPVMPCSYISFKLKAFGFFDENPALDLPAPACRKAKL